MESSEILILGVSTILVVVGRMIGAHVEDADMVCLILADVMVVVVMRSSTVISFITSLGITTSKR